MASHLLLDFISSKEQRLHIARINRQAALRRYRYVRDRCNNLAGHAYVEARAEPLREATKWGEIIGQITGKQPQTTCDLCWGDGLIATGWDSDGDENVEGECPACAGKGFV